MVYKVLYAFPVISQGGHITAQRRTEDMETEELRLDFSNRVQLFAQDMVLKHCTKKAAGSRDPLQTKRTKNHRSSQGYNTVPVYQPRPDDQTTPGVKVFHNMLGI